MPRSERFYLYIATTFSLLLVVSNLITAKIFRMPFTESYALPAGLLTYPFTFLVTDTVTEIWGEKRARHMVLLALVMNLFCLLITQLSLALPAHSAWFVQDNPYGFTSATDYQFAYQSVFGVCALVIMGSMAAYLVSQLLDVWIFARIRAMTGNRHLWLRNNISTLLSQAVDTVVIGSIYCFIGMKMEWRCGFSIMLSAYIYKAVFSICDTPLLYLAVGSLRSLLAKEES